MLHCGRSFYESGVFNIITNRLFISNQFHSKWTEYDTTKLHMRWQISSHAIALLLSKIFSSNSNNKSNLRHGWWNDLFTLDIAVCPWIACPLSQEYNSPRFRGCDECASGIAILLNIDKRVPVAHRPTKLLNRNTQCTSMVHTLLAKGKHCRLKK